eukprot:1161410-Pelagomonas_calceolata.AAC.2
MFHQPDQSGYRAAGSSVSTMLQISNGHSPAVFQGSKTDKKCNGAYEKTIACIQTLKRKDGTGGEQLNSQKQLFKL